MSITQLYTPDEFFVSAKPNEFRLGQICWVPIPMPDSIPRILDVQRNTPEEHEEIKFELRLGNQQNDFKQQDCLFVIPCYSIQSEEYGTGFIQPIVARTQCLMYRQFFYILKSNRFAELIARFDRVQAVIDRSPASIEPSDVCLSEEVFNLFLSMFIFCVSGKTNENLETVQALVREAYVEE